MNSDNVETIRIMYHPGAYKIETHGAWYDLATPTDLHLKAGTYGIIPFGISMKMPDGYEGYLAPRSSTFLKWGILQANAGPGIIENEYCSSNDIWGMPFYATRDIDVPAGTRLAQFRIQKLQPEIEFEEVDSLDEYEERGGYGSTGEQAEIL